MQAAQSLRPWPGLKIWTLFGIVGALSGLLSAEMIYVVDNVLGVPRALDPRIVVATNFGGIPGLTFGLVVGLALRFMAILPRGRYVAFVGVSAVSNLISFFVFVGSQQFMADWSAGYLAGLFGSGCFALAAVILAAPKRPVAAFCFLTLIGGLLGAMSALVFMSSAGIWAFLALWQSGFAMTLYGFLKAD